MSTEPIIKLKAASREYRDDPWTHFGRLRERGSVIRIKMPFMGKIWAATMYESVNDVLKNQELFCRDPKNAGRTNYIPMQWILPKSFFSVVHNMLGADGEKHRRLRSVVDKAFARRNIDGMSDNIEAIASQQVLALEQKFKSNGVVDLMQDFARPFPLTVICELLGLPLEDRPKFFKWFEPFSTVSSVFGIFKFGNSIKAITKYLRLQFEEVRKHPRDGLISELVQMEDEGEQLNESELLSMVFLLLAAGHETTVHLISNTILTLMQHSQVKAELENDWSLAPQMIGEVLRYASPVQFGKPRYVVEDTEYFGQPLKRSQMIIPILACANYDPARFENPNEFDIHRGQNYHMTFGSGPHVCLGMKLARSETLHAVKSLFERFPNLQADFDLKNPDWAKRIGMRSLKTLRVKLAT